MNSDDAIYQPINSGSTVTMSSEDKSMLESLYKPHILAFYCDAAGKGVSKDTILNYLLDEAHSYISDYKKRFASASSP